MSENKKYTTKLDEMVDEVLYIDADEDHISKQFEVIKGDIKKNPNGTKYNTMP